MKPKRTAPTQEQLRRFRAYFALNPTWGSLHVVLDDENVEDCHVQSCIEFAQSRGDAEGAALGHVLLALSQSQRMKIACNSYAIAEPPPTGV